MQIAPIHCFAKILPCVRQEGENEELIKHECAMSLDEINLLLEFHLINSFKNANIVCYFVAFLFRQSNPCGLSKR